MTNDVSSGGLPNGNRRDAPDDADTETVATTAADVESAGRSCMAIVVLLGLIMLLLVIWLVARSLGVGS